MSDRAKDDVPEPESVVAPTPNGKPVTGEIDNSSDAAEKYTVKDESDDVAINVAEADTSVERTVEIDEKIENDMKVKNDDELKSASGTKDDFKSNREKGKHPHTKRPNHSKFDPSGEPITDDAGLIRRQVDFYFSDTNLPTDKYMWELTDGPSNLPIKVTKIHSFKRMRRFQPYSAVVAALRESVTLDVVGEDGSEEVNRKVPYDPNRKDFREPRTVYVKGFGEEQPTTQFDIEAFFAEYGPTNSVRLRRTDDKMFKGSCWIEFQDEETALKFLALDPKPLWQGKEELKIMSMKDYKAEKTQMIKDGLQEPNEARAPFRGRWSRGRGGGHRDVRPGRNNGDRDPNDWKRRREDDQKSGFRDQKRERNGGHSSHQTSRGGRGRGRGNDKNRRDNDRNAERDEKAQKAERQSNIEGESAAKDTESKSDKKESNQKRAREEDNTGDVPAKRLDTKEMSADAS